MKYIYKIENKINNKVYIGQTSNISKRWSSHKNNKETTIGKAIQKHGESNFDFSIIEFTDDYNLREQFWIAYYNSYKGPGYNSTPGGEGKSLFSKEDIEEIHSMLLSEEVSVQEIASKYSVHPNAIYAINRGESHCRPGVKYPIKNPSRRDNLTKAEIQKYEKVLSEFDSVEDFVKTSKQITRTLAFQINRGEHPESSKDLKFPIVQPKNRIRKDTFLAIEKDLLDTKSSFKSIAEKHSVERELVAVINQRKHFYSEQGQPIRKSRSLSQEEVDFIEQELMTNKTIVDMSKELQRSQSIIRKINRGEHPLSHSKKKYPIR